MTIEAKYATSVELFVELAQRTVRSHERLHVVQGAQPDFGESAYRLSPDFEEDVLEGKMPTAWKRPELFAAALVEEAVVLGVSFH